MAGNRSGASGNQLSERRGQLIAIGILAVLLIAVLIFVSQSGNDDSSSSPADASKSTTQLLGSLPQSGTVLGEPSAKVTLVEFGDLQCPFCAKFADDVLPRLIKGDVADGNLKIDFQPLTFIGPDSVTAARTAAGLIPQGKYWNFVDLFYTQQQEENTGYVTQDYLRNLLGEIPGVDVDAALKQADLPSSDKVLSTATKKAQALNVSSTPSLFLSTDGGQPQKLSADPSDGDAVVAEIGKAVNGQ